jgi:hypothetical protein
LPVACWPTFNSLYEIPHPSKGWGNPPEDAFNSLYEIQRIRTYTITASNNSLSILSMRFVKDPRFLLLLEAITFNSLYEILIDVLLSAKFTSISAFNSLYEIRKPHPSQRENT